MRALLKSIFVVSVPMLLLCLGAAHAQTTVLPLATESYEESFQDNPPIGGNLLVGLSWDTSPGLFNPAEIRVELVPTLPVRSVCVSVASQDGRYASRNLYRIPDDAVAVPSFQIDRKSVV